MKEKQTQEIIKEKQYQMRNVNVRQPNGGNIVNTSGMNGAHKTTNENHDR